MPRVLQMYDEDVTKEVLSFFLLPWLDVDGKTFLSIDEYQRLTENWSSLTDDQKYLEKLRREFEDNTNELAERKKEMES